MEPMRAFAESGKFAYPPVFWTYTGTLADMMVKGLQEIVLGTLTPEELVQQLDETAGRTFSQQLGRLLR